MEFGEKWAASPNVGMLDIVAALEWVRDNISNFGGDPGKVMIFGQSGGGAKVGTLMGMPSAKGLFHRASIQSGSSLRQIERVNSARTASLLLLELGLNAATIDRIQELPNEQIIQAIQGAARRTQAAAGRGLGRGAASGGAAAFGWGPTVDGSVLPRHSFDPDASPLSADVPLLVGTVLNESTNSIQQGDPSLDDMPMEELRRRLTQQRGEKAAAIIEVLQKAHPKAAPYELLSRINGAGTRQGAVTQAERKAAQKAAPVYLYWFTWQTPILNGRPRAFHCAELSFCFYNIDRCVNMTGGGPEAHALASKVAGAWINFARHGDPNHAGIPKWAPFTAADCPTMVFDDICAARNNPDKAERDVLRA
jgi:para-nitrobenzyl esterase